MDSINEAIRKTKENSLKKLEQKKDKASLTNKCIIATWKLACMRYKEIYPDVKIRIVATAKSATIFRKHAYAYYGNDDASWVQLLEDIVIRWNHYLPYFRWMVKNSGPPATPDLQFIAIYLKYFVQYSQELIKTEAKNAHLLEAKKLNSSEKINPHPARDSSERINPNLSRDSSLSASNPSYTRDSLENSNPPCKRDSPYGSNPYPVRDIELDNLRKLASSLKEELDEAKRKHKKILKIAVELGYDENVEIEDAINGDYELPPEIT